MGDFDNNDNNNVFCNLLKRFFTFCGFPDFHIEFFFKIWKQKNEAFYWK